MSDRHSKWSRFLHCLCGKLSRRKTSGKNRFALFPAFLGLRAELLGLWVSPAGSVGANSCATGAPRPQTPQSLRFRSGRRLVCVPPAHGAPSTPGLSCLSLAAHFFRSAWPACALRVTKRRPLYRNTRNLTIAKVPPHFWGYGLPGASGQQRPQWERKPGRGRYFDRQHEAPS